jgi:uncharacterized protein (DUF1810 family)
VKCYLSAQNTGTTNERALEELKAGRKRSHWIWFVLPQLQGLGRSAMAEHYGINRLQEAKAYLAEPTLLSRLEEVIAVIAEQLQKPEQSLERLMGGNLDATKTISCLTLFEAAGLNSAEALLNQLGRRCNKTQALLNAPAPGPSRAARPPRRAADQSG